MAVTTEIAPNIFRISIFAPSGNLQFNHFLVNDDEPLLFHTGQYDIQRSGYRCIVEVALKQRSEEYQVESRWPTFSEIGKLGLFAVGFPTGDSISSSGRNRAMRQSSAPLGKWC